MKIEVSPIIYFYLSYNTLFLKLEFVLFHTKCYADLMSVCPILRLCLALPFFRRRHCALAQLVPRSASTEMGKEVSNQDQLPWKNYSDKKKRCGGQNESNVGLLFNIHPINRLFWYFNCICCHDVINRKNRSLENRSLRFLSVIN